MSDPQVIWLAPYCAECARHDHSDTGRTWCEDDVYEPCEECGRGPVKYAICADLVLDVNRALEGK